MYKAETERHRLYPCSWINKLTLCYIFYYLDNNVCYYGMRDQIWHKLCFIRDYIPADTRLILIGHSIGSYFILHMMEELEPNRVLKAMLLFPTIERIALSSSGKSLTTFVKYFGWLAPLPMYPVFYLTPATIKEIVLRWYFKGKDIPDSVIETTQLISDPKSFRNFVSMGNEELQNVVHADYHIIEKNLSKLMIYYGARDHWCPVEYYEDMKAKYPNGDIRLCKGNYDHAFILEHSKPVAEICCQFIQEHIHLDQTDSL